jgi:hypothetical protein
MANTGLSPIGTPIEVSSCSSLCGSLVAYDSDGTTRSNSAASFSVARLTVPCHGHEIGLLIAPVRADARRKLVTVHERHA